MTYKPRKPAKFTATGKITLTAISLVGFVGGWNVIARLENRPAQASDIIPAPLPTQAAALQPTPWPTIAPLPTLAPIRTLAIDLSGEANSGAHLNPTANIAAAIELAPMQLAPLPTLAPLPEMPTAPPPPLPVQPAGNWNQSGGS